MHQRMSPQARQVISVATNAAADLDAERTESEHFLIALVAVPGSAAQDYLQRHGVTQEAVEVAVADTRDVDVSFDDDDAAALAALGFDLPEILRQLDERFDATPPAPQPKRGPRRLRVGFGDSAKQLLHRAMIEASYRDEGMTPEHLLLGLLHEPSALCADLLSSFRVSYTDARDTLFPPQQRDAG